MNNDFYRSQHESFSRTRKAAWPGWERVCSQFPIGEGPFAILDAACGNLRFEQFMLERFPKARLEFSCIDSCAELVYPLNGVAYSHIDILENLLNGGGINPGERTYNAAVSFGFMHHIPTQRLRSAFMRAFLETLEPNGIAAFSFWQFLKDEKMAKRAGATTREAVSAHDLQLEQNDFVVGWDNQPGALRYCHSFTEEEVDELVDSLYDLGTCVDRFNSDGRNGVMNGYAVIHRR